MALVDNLIDNVNAELEKRGWSQRELARRSDVHWQTVRGILSGETNPTIAICEKLMNALEMNPGKIFRNHS